MFSGNESISHYSRNNVIIWMTMAFQAGAMNIGAFLACRKFVSHVTGFATLFGEEVSRSRFKHAAVLLIVPLFFLLGAMLSGWLVDLRLAAKKKPRYYISFGVIFFLNFLVLLLGTFGYFGEFGQSKETLQNSVMLIILCLGCGIQNGAVTTVSKSVIRTTHLTGVTTDLGLGLMRSLAARKIFSLRDNEMRANAMRFGIILFFGLGSVAGGFLLSQLAYRGFLLPVLTSGALFASSVYFARKASSARL